MGLPEPNTDDRPRLAPRAEQPTCRPACPACGGRLIEIRAKLVCSRCHTISETCCEGGRG